MILSLIGRHSRVLLRVWWALTGVSVLLPALASHGVSVAANTVFAVLLGLGVAYAFAYVVGFNMRHAHKAIGGMLSFFIYNVLFGSALGSLVELYLCVAHPSAYLDESRMGLFLGATMGTYLGLRKLDSKR